MLPTVARSKTKQAIKFGRLTKYKKIFLKKNCAENEAGKLVPDLFLFFEKASNEVKASGLHLSVINISIALSLDMQ